MERATIAYHRVNANVQEEFENLNKKHSNPVQRYVIIGLTGAENITVCFRKQMHPQSLEHGAVRYSRSEDTT